jgi:hypothetical protein
MFYEPLNSYKYCRVKNEFRGFCFFFYVFPSLYFIKLLSKYAKLSLISSMKKLEYLK